MEQPRIVALYQNGLNGVVIELADGQSLHFTPRKFADDDYRGDVAIFTNPQDPVFVGLVNDKRK